MAYYFLIHETINDIDAYQRYSPPAVESFSKHGGKILVASGPGMGDAKMVERTPQHAVTILLEFESEAAFDAWYQSPEYQAVVGTRIGATDGWAQGLPGFPAPT